MKPLLLSLASVAVAATIQAADPVPAANPHFAAVASQIEEGGDLYLYLNLRPFSDLLGSLVDRGVTTAVSVVSAEKPEDAGRIQSIYGMVKSVANKMGLDEFGDVGVSTRGTDNGLFRTRFFLGKRDATANGLMWTWGVKNGPGLPAVKRMPADTVLAMSSRPDVAAFWTGLKSLVAGTPAQAPLEAGLAEALKNGVDVEAVIRSIGDEAFLALSLDEKRTLEFPGVGEIPAPGLVVSLKLNDTTIPTLLTVMTAGLKDQVVPTNVNGVAVTQVVLPDAPPFIAPCWTVQDGWLLVAHHPDALAKALDLAKGKGASLADNAEFRSFAQGMPEQAYAMSFISRRLMKTYSEVLGKVIAAGGNTPPGMTEALEQINQLTQNQSSALSVGELVPGGIRATTHSPFNYSISFTAAVLVAPVAISAAVILPGVTRAVKVSQGEESAAPELEPEPAPEAPAPEPAPVPEPAPEPAPEPRPTPAQKADNSPKGKCLANQELLQEAVAAFSADEGRLPRNVGELRPLIGPRPVRCPSGGTYTLPRKAGEPVTCNIDGHSH